MRAVGGQKAWVYCRRCQEAALLRSGALAGFQSDEQDCLAHFLDVHARHPLTQLVPTRDDRCVYLGPVWGLNTTAWIEVTDGRDIFVVEASRPDMNEPRRYRVLTGSLPPQRTVMDIDEALATRAWVQVFGTSCHRGVLPRIFARVRQILAATNCADIDPEFSDANDPQVQFATWPPRAWAALEEAGCRELPKALHPRWREFLREHACAQGAWGLRLRTELLRPMAAELPWQPPYNHEAVCDS